MAKFLHETEHELGWLDIKVEMHSRCTAPKRMIGIKVDAQPPKRMIDIKVVAQPPNA